MSRSTALLLLALSAAAPAAARPLVELEIVDRDSGQLLEQARHRGEHWIVGAPGHRYAVRLTNTSGERVLVVLSVDGVNAVTGDTASPDQGGYVLAPWQSSQIAGWRKSHEDVAQFVFTSLPDSYAARTGRPDHVAVIGIAVFQEARTAALSRSDVATPPPAPARRSRESSWARSGPQDRRTADAAAAAESTAGQRLGTGHGAREWSPVSSTVFQRASATAAQVMQIRYDARARLIARGVLPRRWDHAPPRAFPGRFVADPPR